MTSPGSPRPLRPRLSPAGRALRLQRIFARLHDGATYAEIAVEEGISRERLRQIISAAAASRDAYNRPDRAPNHGQMQISRLTPALRLAAAGVAAGDTKAIPLLLQIVDRLDRYYDPDESFKSPLREALVAPERPRRARVRRQAEASPRLVGGADRPADPPSVAAEPGEGAAEPPDAS